MIALFHVKKEVDIKVISAAFHAVYYAALHKAEKRNLTLINRCGFKLFPIFNFIDAAGN